MKIIYNIILVLLILLAIASGVTKVMPQEVDLFGKYGFSAPILLGYGITQIFGGALMIFQRFRLFGAALVAISFITSLAVFLVEGNIPLSIITVIATLLLGFVMLRNIGGDS